MVPSCTFPPEARLHTTADFAGLRRCRKPLRSRFFIIRHVPGSHGMARLGMAVSRKTSKRAVDRNRIKRSVREAFRQHRHDLPAIDLLIISLPPAASASPRQLRQELMRQWPRLRQIHAPAPTSDASSPTRHRGDPADRTPSA